MSLELLKLLRRSRDHWLSISDLRKTLKQPPPIIHEQIEQLRRLGYEIEMVPTYGLRLTGRAANLTAELIEYGLATRRIGRRVLLYETTDSTNDVAWNYATESGYDGLVVFAKEQRLGRGRMGRNWHSARNSSILCSVLLQKQIDFTATTLTLLAGLATALAVESCGARQTRIKWPNDVMVDDKKLAGIMVESRRIHHKTLYVIGIGINCRQAGEDFPPPLREKAVSLRQITGSDIDQVQLAQELLRQLDHWLLAAEEGQVETLHTDWLARCRDVGRRITLISDGQSFTGRMVDVSVEEGLILQLDTGPIKIFDAATTTVKID